eukprot:c24726_g1_i3 orf=399-2249(-)
MRGRWWSYGGACRYHLKMHRCWLVLLLASGLLLLCWDTRNFRACGRFYGAGIDKYPRMHHDIGNIHDGGNFKQKTGSFRKEEVSHTYLQTTEFHGIGTETVKSSERYILDGEPKGRSSPVIIESAVSFTDGVLLIVNPFHLRDAYWQAEIDVQLQCLFSGKIRTKVLSADQGFVRCEFPPTFAQDKLNGGEVTLEVGSQAQSSGAIYGQFIWKKLVYGLVLLEDENDALLLVKGIVSKKKGSAPEDLQCLFGNKIITEVIAFCQENVRCRLPLFLSHTNLIGKTVTLIVNGSHFPSVARYYPQGVSGNLLLPYSGPVSLGAQKTSKERELEGKKQYNICACTMVWNGAKFLREWVIYHSYLGVQRFFIYDNNSEDNISSVVESLVAYNVSRHAWPWMKTQEAGFSHCSIRALEECLWVLFVDLDEFIFLKQCAHPGAQDSLTPLHRLITLYDAAAKGQLGQLKISCYNFGPSGLTTLPKSGQTVNYICRMNAQKRVKSIVRLKAVNNAYCSRVHHFELKQGFVSARAAKDDAVIHHYKYPVWEDFKVKFIRRVATFVADWKEKKDMDSYDRTPGLGNEAVEPIGWAHWFCEMEDTELRDYVLKVFRFQNSSKLIWE